jgi:lysyl-tRNA synthetase class 2
MESSQKVSPENNLEVKETSEQSFRNERLANIAEYEKKGDTLYPHKFDVTVTFKEFRQKYEALLQSGERKDDVIECVAGRIQEKRSSGQKLFFYTVYSDGVSLQYLADIREYKDTDHFKHITSIIHRGDIVGVRGFVGKSHRGELSIIPLEMKILTPCLKHIPKLAFGIADQDLRYRKRYLDLIANQDTRNVFIVRAKVYKEIRSYLDNKDFIEVQTPILSGQVGGASARPFITYHNDLDQEMFLRIAPELYLKQLVVGGLNRVYEIGPQFRNEGIDLTHSPEFHSLEYYMAYADYNDLMKMCEEMFSQIAFNIHKKYKLEYNSLNSKDATVINWEPPYRRIDMIPELEKMTGVTFPTEFDSDTARAFFDNLCKDKKVDCGQPRTTARLLDKLVGYYIEPLCINPTFIMNHPLIMSPLAKQHRDNSQITERFELFVCGMELANAYTELNNPLDQRERFTTQLKAKNEGDDEAQGVDETFIDSLEYGLPPTGGFGTGIDRLVMLMSNKNTIRDVITFPTLANNKE